MKGDGVLALVTIMLLLTFAWLLLLLLLLSLLVEYSLVLFELISEKVERLVSKVDFLISLETQRNFELGMVLSLDVMGSKQSPLLASVVGVGVGVVVFVTVTAFGIDALYVSVFPLLY